MTLLTKTRTLNRLLQKAAGQAVNFREMSEVLQETIEANVYVVSRKGKILGSAVSDSFQSPELHRMVLEDQRFPADYNHLLMKIEETTSNQDAQSPFVSLTYQLHRILEHKYITVVPIIGGGDRVGTLLLSRVDKEFIDDDLILAEYGSTIVGMEILRERADEIEVYDRSKA
ncbi:MAG TPA: GTP-sensing pleiotropic transcriptional regulator CodY, partial [Bacilli bacterium]